MTKRDIVMRLCGPINILSADDLAYEAADAITRLREELAEAKAESLHAKSAMAEQINALCETLRIVNDKMEELRKERDEARREVCCMKDFHGLPRDYALERGWDCFKEEP